MTANWLKRIIWGLAVLSLVAVLTGCNMVYEPGTYTPRDPIAERRAELRQVK